VPPERAERPGLGFGALTAALDAWAAWLRPCQSETVVLEATGVDGMALCAVLAARGFAVKLGEPQTGRPVPGRQTDVQEGQWRPALHPYG
jgi:transposase